MIFNFKKIDYLKTIIIFILIFFILGLTFFPNIFKINSDEYFTTLRDYYLVDNIHLYNENKALSNHKCKSPILNLQKSLTHSSYNSNDDTTIYNDNLLLKELVPINFSRLGYINRLVEIKQGSLSLMVNNKGYLEFRNMKIDMKGYHTATFKIILGLYGTDTVSFYHIPTDSFISRTPNGTLFLSNVELTDDITKQASSYKLCYGLNDINNITISCPMIYKENTPRVWQLKKNYLGINNYPTMIKFNSLSPENYPSIEFYFKDVNSGTILPTIYHTYNHNNRHKQVLGIISKKEDALGQYNIETFLDNNTAHDSSGIRRNMRNKRNVTSLLNEGILNMKDISLNKQPFLNISSNNNIETFNQSSNNNTDNINNINIFDVNSGKNFHKVLTYDMIGKNYSNILDDKLVEKLQKQQVDPSVQSLLDYTEKYYDVYRKENDEFETKLNTFLDTHLNNVDYNIRKTNNYRVSQMAKQLFNAESILEEKTRL